MKLGVIYCTHERTGLSVRERLALTTPEQYAHAYEQFQKHFPNMEAVFISTCNRIELYFASEDAADIPDAQALARFLSEMQEVPLDDLINTLIDEEEMQAVQHLFEVACGLDSMVLGESQIVNQVKTAYEIGQLHQAVGPLLHSLFQSALKVAGRVRTETKLSEGRISIASVAVGEFASQIFDTFADKNIVVIGAGEMAEETLRYLKEEGAHQISVVNRTLENAQALASKWNGHARAIENLDSILETADIVVSTLATEKPFLDAKRMQCIQENRKHRTLFLLDLGSPRNVDPAVGDIDESLFLYNIDDLESACHRNRKARSAEAEKAAIVVEQAVETFQHDVFHRTTGAVIKRLREHWHGISKQELERLTNKLEHLTESDCVEIEKTVSRIVNKLLHPPLEEIKSQSRQGTPHTLIETLKKLFQLHD